MLTFGQIKSVEAEQGMIADDCERSGNNYLKKLRSLVSGTRLQMIQRIVSRGGDFTPLQSFLSGLGKSIANQRRAATANSLPDQRCQRGRKAAQIALLDGFLFYSTHGRKRQDSAKSETV